MLSEATVAAISNEVLARFLADAGFDHATVEARPDHSGEDGLYVTVTFKPASPATTGRVTSDAMVALIDALKSRGDLRFPYLIYDYPDDDRPHEPDLDAAE